MASTRLTTEEEDSSIANLRQNRCSWSVKDRDVSRLLEFPRTETKWCLDPIFYERRREEYQMELSGICVATQAVGSIVGLKAIVKTRIQLIKHAQPAEKEIEGVEGVPDVFSDDAEIELQALKRLTDAGCTATPKLLDYKVEIQTKNDTAVGAYVLYVLMEKVPGQNLLHFGGLSMEERNEARIAFGVALRDLYSYGYRHDDPHPSNIIWDPESNKCHIVDLESLVELKTSHRPARIGDFYLWSLVGPGDWKCYDVDPMIVELDPGNDMPDETELRKVANETMEKGLSVVKDYEPTRRWME
ncbi:hypothetical protein FQN54_006761 [Arachnomyces sp. PD_36]|nr:hypothetical protein FQN54_006761 [Arachnomyces sp. PD_36]